MAQLSACSETSLSNARSAAKPGVDDSSPRVAVRRGAYRAERRDALDGWTLRLLRAGWIDPGHVFGLSHPVDVQVDHDRLLSAAGGPASAVNSRFAPHRIRRTYLLRRSEKEGSMTHLSQLLDQLMSILAARNW